MRTNYEIRYAAHPEDAKSYDTKRIRRDFLIEKVFSPNEVNMVYSMYDRMGVGGATPGHISKSSKDCASKLFMHTVRKFFRL